MAFFFFLFWFREWLHLSFFTFYKGQAKRKHTKKLNCRKSTAYCFTLNMDRLLGQLNRGNSHPPRCNSLLILGTHMVPRIGAECQDPSQGPDSEGSTVRGREWGERLFACLKMKSAGCTVRLHSSPTLWSSLLDILSIILKRVIYNIHTVYA